MRQSLNKQRGISLPGMAIALAVGAVLMLGVSYLQVRSANELAGRTLGSTLNELGKAVELYRSTYSGPLTGPVAGASVPGFADPYQPKISELQAAGFLAPALTLDDADYSIIVRRNPAGCVADPAAPTPEQPCTLWTLAAANRPVTAPGGRINAARLNALVSRISSASASYSTEPNTAVIIGGGGSWSIPNPDPATRAGIVVLVNGLGASSEPWLRVGDTRNPDFKGPSVTGRQFDTPHVVIEAACQPQGAFASSATGIAFCNAGVWQKYSGPTVVAGDACSAPGALGVATNGSSLMCINGQWRDHLTYGVRSTAYYAHNAIVTQPTCGAGLTPTAVIASVAASVIIGANNPGNNTGSFDASIDPTSWAVAITGSTGVQAGAGSRALVIASCSAL